MQQGGIETIIGIQHDALLGPMFMFGLSGVVGELFRNVAFASAPLSSADARRLIASSRGAALLLDGWRGAAPSDLNALVNALVSVSAYVAVNAGRLESLEINLFMVGFQGSIALDALGVLRGGEPERV